MTHPQADFKTATGSAQEQLIRGFRAKHGPLMKEVLDNLKASGLEDRQYLPTYSLMSSIYHLDLKTYPAKLIEAIFSPTFDLSGLFGKKRGEHVMGRKNRLRNLDTRPVLDRLIEDELNPQDRRQEATIKTRGYYHPPEKCPSKEDHLRLVVEEVLPQLKCALGVKVSSALGARRPHKAKPVSNETKALVAAELALGRLLENGFAADYLAAVDSIETKRQKVQQDIKNREDLRRQAKGIAHQNLAQAFYAGAKNKFDKKYPAAPTSETAAATAPKVEA